MTIPFKLFHDVGKKESTYIYILGVDIVPSWSTVEQCVLEANICTMVLVTGQILRYMVEICFIMDFRNKKSGIISQCMLYC